MAKKVEKKSTGDKPAARKTNPRTASRTTGTRAPRGTKPVTKPMPTEEQIRQRAYEIYLSRNGGPGDPRADWLQAERELTGGAAH